MLEHWFLVIRLLRKLTNKQTNKQMFILTYPGATLYTHPREQLMVEEDFLSSYKLELSSPDLSTLLPHLTGREGGGTGGQGRGF